jgi:hypothetical protein
MIETGFSDHLHPTELFKPGEAVEIHLPAWLRFKNWIRRYPYQAPKKAMIINYRSDMDAWDVESDDGLRYCVDRSYVRKAKA